LKIDLTDCNLGIIKWILTTDCDVAGLVRKMGADYQRRMSTWDYNWEKGLTSKQKNLVIVANLVEIIGTAEFNDELLAVWEDKSEKKMVRDLCLEAALVNCDEKTYMRLREKLLESGKMTLREKTCFMLKVLSNNTNHYAIPLSLVVKVFPDKVFSGASSKLRQEILDRTANRRLSDFRVITKYLGYRGVLKYWTENRDYLRPTYNSTHNWQLDNRNKYCDALGVSDRDRVVLYSQLLMGGNILADFDKKNLEERTGLTQKQFSRLPIEKLLLWDKVSDKEKQELLRWIPIK